MAWAMVPDSQTASHFPLDSNDRGDARGWSSIQQYSRVVYIPIKSPFELI